VRHGLGSYGRKITLEIFHGRYSVGHFGHRGRSSDVIQLSQEFYGRAIRVQDECTRETLDKVLGTALEKDLEP
jgi:hypothetical protein